MPDLFIDHDSQPKQLAEAGLSAKDIVAAGAGGDGDRDAGSRGSAKVITVAMMQTRRRRRRSCGRLRLACCCCSGRRAGSSRRCRTADCSARQPLQRVFTPLWKQRCGPAGRRRSRSASMLLAPVVDQVFDLETVLKVSVGLRWDAMDADRRSALLKVFRRFTVATYVANFDKYDGERFEILPGIARFRARPDRRDRDRSPATASASGSTT